MSGPSIPRVPEALTFERLKHVVAALHEGVAILDAEGFVDFINPSGEAILGVPSGDVLGWKLSDFRWEIVDQDGGSLPREAHPALRVLATGEPQSTTVLGMRSPAVAGTVWVEVSARPLHADGSQDVAGSVSTFRDVSGRVAAEAALRASEQRYEMLAESVPTGIFHTDADGRCIWVNHAWTALTGRSVAESAEYGWFEAVHPDDRARVSTRWQECMASGEPYLLEHRLLDADGQTRWVVCRTALSVASDGSAPGHIGSVTDITDVKAAGQFKDQLLALVSHELRAPLVAIQGGLAFLEPYVRGADADGLRLYDIALRNARLLERLVRDLLDIERLDGGQLPLDLEPVPLRPLLNEARDSHLAAALDRGVILEEPTGDPATVTADRDRLLQVLNNLITNAVKFSEPGGRVRMDVTVGEDGVVVGVHDRGRGIHASMHADVFERFRQVNPSDSAERGGAGLGLAISRAIIQRHGGRIWVRSELGKGASFYFFLPASS